MKREQLALQLIDVIYQAALDTPAWQRFADELALALDDAAVGFAFQLPGFNATPVYYGSGFDEAQKDRALFEYMEGGLPWEAARAREWVKGFTLGTDVLSAREMLDSAIYRDWMRPQGLAPEAPLGHTIALAEGRPLATVVIFRRDGSPPFDPNTLALVDALVPHLRRAYEIHTRSHEMAALAEALDRIPTGLVLIDARGRPVLCNRTARAIADKDDGFTLDAEGPRAWRRADHAVLMQLVRRAIRPDAHSSIDGGLMALTTKSGRRPFTVLLVPLLEGYEESTLNDAVAALYISDLERGPLRRTHTLHTLYGLTDAESELVDLLCEGLSVEQAASRRGVTRNTARSQLKQVFVKTSTSRQSELMRLVLAGLPPSEEA